MSGNSSLDDICARISPASRAHQNKGVPSAFTGRHVDNGWTSNESDGVYIFLFFNYIMLRSFQEQQSSDRIAISAAAYSEQAAATFIQNTAIGMSSRETSVVAAESA